MPETLSYKTPQAASPTPRSSLRLGWGIALGVVALGFGVAAWVLDGWFNRFDVTVVVVNETLAPIRRAQFDLDGRTFSVDNVAAGATARRQITLRGGGPLGYSVTSQGGATSVGVAASHLDADCEGATIRLRVTTTGVESF